MNDKDNDINCEVDKAEEKVSLRNKMKNPFIKRIGDSLYIKQGGITLILTVLVLSLAFSGSVTICKIASNKLNNRLHMFSRVEQRGNGIYVQQPKEDKLFTVNIDEKSGICTLTRKLHFKVNKKDIEWQKKEFEEGKESHKNNKFSGIATRYNKDSKTDTLDSVMIAMETLSYAMHDRNLVNDYSIDNRGVCEAIRENCYNLKDFKEINDVSKLETKMEDEALSIKLDDSSTNGFSRILNPNSLPKEGKLRYMLVFDGVIVY